MRAIARRLRRLEQHFQPVETKESRTLKAELQAALLRCGVPPTSPERLAELKGMSLVEILNSARRRRPVANQPELGNTAPQIDEAIPPLKPNPLPRPSGP